MAQLDWKVIIFAVLVVGAIYYFETHRHHYFKKIHVPPLGPTAGQVFNHAYARMFNAYVDKRNCDIRHGTLDAWRSGCSGANCPDGKDVCMEQSAGSRLDVENEVKRYVKGLGKQVDADLLVKQALLKGVEFGMYTLAWLNSGKKQTVQRSINHAYARVKKDHPSWNIGDPPVYSV